MIDADDGVRGHPHGRGRELKGADLDRLVGALMAGEPAQDEFEERIRSDFGLIYKGFLKESDVDADHRRG